MMKYSRRRKGPSAGMRRSAAYPTSLSFEALETRWLLSGTGLTGQYFHNSDFTGLAETRTEAVAFNWGTGSPAAGVAADSFSVRWTGQVEPQFSQLYTFRVLSDEGVRVWVDGQLIIDDWSPHVRRFETGTIALAAGQRYDIRIDYYEGSGPAQMELSWTSASQPLELIPAERLYESPSGLLGMYEDASGGSLSRVDAIVDFDWGLSSPHPALDADDVTVRWTGQVQPDFSDEYAFSTISDDGVRLWIGGELVIDNWTNHSATEDVGYKQLEAGKWYDVRLEYYEDVGFAEIELRWSSARQTENGISEVVPEVNLRAAKATAVTFENPLGPGADPFVIQWEGDYYLTRSQGNSVWINRAGALQDIHASSPGSESVLAWTAPPTGNYSGQIWAPELHHIAGRWYIYVAASNGNNATHRMHVLERDAPDPFGPFVYKGQLAAATDRWAIDGTVLEWQGVLYFVWSGWPGFSDGQQNLYIAEMRNPWTLRGDRVLISTPQYGWERHGLSLNEGPQILIHDGQLHIIYSASGFWTPQYALGRLTYNGTGSLLDPASWTKAPLPVFQANSHVVGTGHASFVKSPDGTEDWIVYHAHANPTHFMDDRVIHIQPFTFHADGTPNFGSPLVPGQPVTAPSSGADPERPFLAGDFNADGVVDGADHGTWKATFGQAVFPGSGADGNGNGVVDAADFSMWQDNLGAQASASAAVAQSHDVAAGVAALKSAPVESALHAEVDQDDDPAFLDAPLADVPPALASDRKAVRRVHARHVDAVLSDWRNEAALAELVVLQREARRKDAMAVVEPASSDESETFGASNHGVFAELAYGVGLRSESFAN